MKLTPFSETWARRSLWAVLVTWRSFSMETTLPRPEPSDMTWKPPESVRVGPSQVVADGSGDHSANPPALAISGDWRRRW